MHAERRMYAPTRAVATLAGAAAAGFLVWLATQVGRDGNGEYWAFVGLLAAAGLVLAVSQLLGGWTKWGWPRMSPTVFLVAFLPSLLAGGWVLVAAQPDGNDARRYAVDWAGDIGLGGLLIDLTTLFPVIAFGLGLVFGLTFDTTGPRRAVTREGHAYEEGVAEEPVAAERDEVAARDEFRDPDPDVARTLAGDGARGVEIREGDTTVLPPEERRRP